MCVWGGGGKTFYFFRAEAADAGVVEVSYLALLVGGEGEGVF